MTTETNVDLVSGGVMSGRVVDENGRPIQDAIVDALAMTYANGYPVLRAITTKTTDDEGEYRLFWLVPGEYYLQVAVPPPPGTGPGPVNVNAPSQFSGATRTFYPGTTDVGGATPLTVRAGDKLSGLDIQVRPAPLARVSGSSRPPYRRKKPRNKRPSFPQTPACSAHRCCSCLAIPIRRM